MPAPRLAISVGDSLTHDPYPGEYVGASATAKGWMYSLPALFTTTGFEWRDQAVSGVTTDSYLATYWTAALALRPRWMMLMLGTNDANVGIPTTTQYKLNLNRMFVEARAQKCEVILVTPPPFFYAAPPPLGYTTKVRRPHLVEAYRDAGIVQAVADGVPYIDLYDLAGDNYDTLGFQTAWDTLGLGIGGTDRTHWIAAGATMAANYIAAALPVVSPSLAAYRLTLYSEPAFATIAQVKAAANITTAANDTDLQLVINGVIARMKGWMGAHVSARRFERETQSLATSTTRLVLRNRPIISVVEVRLDGETVAQADYEILLPEGILYNASGWPSGQHHLEVDYTAGYATVPYQITDACVAQSRYVWFQRALGGDRFAEAQRAEAGGGSTAYIVQDWYPGVLDALRPFRRLA